MKKCIIFGALLLIAPALHAITSQEILKKFNTTFGTLFGQGYLFNKAIAPTQNQNIDMWNKAIDDTEIFVVENSKNLVGIKDTDLINAATKIKKASMDLMNAIKIARGSMKGQDAIFARIEKDMKNLANEIKAKTFTLSNKKEAQTIIISVATYVESGANKAYKDATNPPMPTDLPPTLPR